MEEKSHEHTEHKKKDDAYNFQISKVMIWQGISAVLLIAVLVIWFYPSSSGNVQGAAVGQPTLGQPSPGQQQQIPQRQDISLDNDPVLGNKDAPVTIVSFEDYQCPYCGRAFQQTFPLLKKDYVDTGKVKMVFRDYPLPFHPNAEPAAEASECAHEQGKFWEFHDGLFNNQESLGTEFYMKLAGDLKLDTAKFKQCIESGKYKQEVQDDFSYGSQVGVSGTPTFFVNGIMLVGAQPYQAFQQVIEAELKK